MPSAWWVLCARAVTASARVLCWIGDDRVRGIGSHTFASLALTEPSLWRPSSGHSPQALLREEEGNQAVDVFFAQ